MNDIVTEVQRQINSLKRQAAKARRYRRLRDELVNALGVQVFLTRNRDVEVDLDERTAIANNYKADLFISIHSNALSAKSSGTETFRFYSATGAANRLAKSVHGQVVDRLQLPDRGVKTAGFYVLRNTNMPAILLESAFLTNPEEAEFLAQPNVRQQIADAVGTGVARHLADEPGVAAKPKYWVTAGRFRTKRIADRRVIQAQRDESTNQRHTAPSFMRSNPLLDIQL